MIYDAWKLALENWKPADTWGPDILRFYNTKVRIQQTQHFHEKKFKKISTFQPKDVKKFLRIELDTTYKNFN